jgi:hypothetical protein
LIIIFESCSSTKSVNPDIVANNLLQMLHTVDKKTLDDYSKMNNVMIDMFADSKPNSRTNIYKI